MGRNRAWRDPGSPATEDARVESAVLGFVLEEDPDHLTIPELSLAMSRCGAEDFSRNDAIERAIRELVGGGLLRIAAGLVVPTRAALYFERLDVG
jgi:hypothetical protein